MFGYICGYKPISMSNLVEGLTYPDVHHKGQGVDTVNDAGGIALGVYIGEKHISFNSAEEFTIYLEKLDSNVKKYNLHGQMMYLLNCPLMFHLGKLRGKDNVKLEGLIKEGFSTPTKSTTESYSKCNPCKYTADLDGKILITDWIS